MTYQRAHWKVVAERWPCPVCEAGPDSPCISSSGHLKAEPHADRTRLASAHHWKDPEEDEPQDDRGRV